MTLRQFQTIVVLFTHTLACAGGAFGMWSFMSGSHECSVMVSDATGNKAEYVTECEVM